MKTLVSVILIALILLGSGCNKSLDQQNTADETAAPEESDQVQTLMQRKSATPKEAPSATLMADTAEGLSEIHLQKESAATASDNALSTKLATKSAAPVAMERQFFPFSQHSMNQESYNADEENVFKNSLYNPLSTFSIDVDTASYANIRRFIRGNTLPPRGAVRIEEMVNYFKYSYPEPADVPFSISTEVGPSPWHENYKLVRIGLQGRHLDKAGLPPSNLVFLIDVSGSMRATNKLPLLKKSMKMLVNQLSEKDRVAIVTYAGSDCIALSPTAGSAKKKIFTAIDSLASAGSTHGSRGILTAYDLAEQTLMPGGNNRIILASDGDFNVGITSRGELQKLIEEKRQSGIYLTVLGFGMGNYHDDTMELLADKGNGNYAYIDSLLEAKKVMVQQMSNTLFTLAKDVKIQIEFNPRAVGAYRLIGYENRILNDEDFNDDTKDAGEIGVGHQVTAFYELIPAGHDDIPSIDTLKYQKSPGISHSESDELLTVKLRYKPGNANDSKVISTNVKDNNIALGQTSNDFRFAVAVAGYGMHLKQSDYLGKTTLAQLISLARDARGEDQFGYRAECIRLMEMTELLQL